MSKNQQTSNQRIIKSLCVLSLDKLEKFRPFHLNILCESEQKDNTKLANKSWCSKRHFLAFCQVHFLLSVIHPLEFYAPWISNVLDWVLFSQNIQANKNVFMKNISTPSFLENISKRNKQHGDITNNIPNPTLLASIQETISIKTNI